MGMKRIFWLVLAGLICQFNTAPALAADNAGSCASRAEARQLDYWLGEWAVASPGMAGKGHSSVHLSLDKCMLVESWGSDTSDHRGENTMAYNGEDKAWYGLFVDNHGRAHVMTGTVTPGSAVLQGPSRDENGGAVLKRVKIVLVNTDAVEQIWERSADNGVSWTTDFKMEYVRKKL
jgi:hypothetical protein